jgi:hypothetical protein
MEVSFMRNDWFAGCLRGARWLALVASLHSLGTLNLCAQAPPPPASTFGAQFPTLTLSYGNGRTLAVRPDRYPDHQDFQPIAIYPDQQLRINLQFPTSSAGQTILVGVLDGSGTITTATNAGAVTIGNDGSVVIGYQAPHDPGHCQVTFRFGTQNSVLPLTVLNSVEAARPGNCPRTN